MSDVGRIALEAYDLVKIVEQRATSDDVRRIARLALAANAKLAAYVGAPISIQPGRSGLVPYPLMTSDF